MEIVLFKNGREFLESKYSKNFNVKDDLTKIEEFSNKNFIILYDNFLVYSKDRLIHTLGVTDNYVEIIKDLFYRNICLDKISDLKLCHALKKTFNYSIYKEENYYKTIKSNIRRTLFSGGCFWCMAHPYYEFDGVLNVISGYAGGSSINPNYLDTKHGNGYKETVFIEYDNNKISYKELLKLYFESIDPFDTEGQFIDKGESYQTQVYFKDELEENIFNEYKIDIEKRYKLKVAVKTHCDSLFYKAEEEHQNFEFKNKDKFITEEHISGRDNYNYVKLD